MSNKAIFCVALGKTNPMYECAIKSFAMYAKKVGADLIVHREKSLSNNWDLSDYSQKRQQIMGAMCEKLYAIELLKQYQQVLLIDCDVLIQPDAEDIFTKYNDNTKIYAFCESRFCGELTDGIKDITRIERLTGKIDDWPKTGEYKQQFSAGVILFGNQSPVKQHVSLDEARQFFNCAVYLEQTYLNYLVAKHKLPFAELDQRYNWISYLNKRQGRETAYFAHHAVNGYGKSKCLRVDTFVNDYLWYFDKKKYYLTLIPRKITMFMKLIKHNIRKLI